MSSLEALLPDDLEKHVQLNRAKLNSYGGECRGHAARNAKQKGSSHPGGDDPMDIGAFGKGKGKQGKGKHGKGKGKGKGKQGQQGQQGQQGRDGGKDKDKNNDSIECWNCGKRGHYLKDCWSKKNTNKGGTKGKRKSKNATDAHNLDSTKPARWIISTLTLLKCRGLNGSRLESTQVQERRHGPRVSHTGRSFLSMSTSLSAQRLERLSNLVRDCTWKVATIGESISVFGVFKRRCVNYCCLSRRWVESLSSMVTKVTCFTKGSNVAKKIDAWIQKKMRDSQYCVCTDAYNENNVYNIYLKPKGNKTDAMPLSEDTDNRPSGGCRPGPNP